MGVAGSSSEGGHVLVSQGRYGVPASLRFYPIAIVIAGASVLL